jgi:hypothetical protein
MGGKKTNKERRKDTIAREEGRKKGRPTRQEEKNDHKEGQQGRKKQGRKVEKEVNRRSSWKEEMGVHK